MSHSSDRPAREQAGFTLIEALISITILVIVLLIAFALLFSMKAFAQRQELFVSPRQTARRAIDYLSYYVRTAADLNAQANNPNALVMYYQNFSLGTNIQASFNNLTGNEPGNGTVTLTDTATYPQTQFTSSTFGDLGTDIITMAHAVNAGSISINTWNPSSQPAPDASNLYFNYTAGCPDNALNMEMFMNMTGDCWSKCAGAVPCNCNSDVLTLMDSTGNWTYYMITGYQQSTCSDTNGDIIHVTNTPGESNAVNPPGGPDTLNKPLSIGAGVHYVTFRVYDHKLQQKRGLFDPATAGTGWTTLLDNVEDFQIAYLYNDGTIENDAGHTLTTPNEIPTQPNPPGNSPPDITQVIGLRITIVARSPRSLPPTILGRDKYVRPAAEDHPAGNKDKFYHYRLTATILLRNRMLGS